MPFELYIWGPAFGLESIDPECLAAVAYLSLAAPQPGTWSVVPTSSSAVSCESTLFACQDTASQKCT